MERRSAIAWARFKVRFARISGALQNTDGGRIRCVRCHDYRGRGYTSPPSVAFAGGGGTGAAAYATIDGAGNVTAVIITAPGHNYTGAPTVSFSGGGGSGATAAAAFAQCDVNTKEACRRAMVELKSIDINSVHPDDSEMRVDSVNVGDGLTLRDVTVNYSRPVNGGTHPTKSSKNPADRPIRYKWSGGEETVSVDRDVNGNPIVNSAGSPFASDPTDQREFLTLEVRRAFTYFNIAAAFAYFGKTNSSDWNLSVLGIIVPAGCAKCKTILPADELTQLSDAVDVVYTFELRPDGFTTDITDQGVNAAVTNSDSPTRIRTQKGTDETTRADSEEVLLNGKGGVLKATYSHPTLAVDWTGKPSYITPISVGGGSAFKLRYTLKTAVDFNALGL